MENKVNYSTQTEMKKADEIVSRIKHNKYVPKKRRNKRTNKIEGLGDLIEETLRVTGIKKMHQMARVALGKPAECGKCQERKKAANESELSKALFKKD